MGHVTKVTCSGTHLRQHVGHVTKVTCGTRRKMYIQRNLLILYQLVYWLITALSDKLIDLLVDRLTACQINWLVAGWLIEGLIECIGWLMDWRIDWLVCWYIHRKIQKKKSKVRTSVLLCNPCYVLSIYFLSDWFYLDALSVCLTVWSRQIVNFRVPKKEQMWLNN